MPAYLRHVGAYYGIRLAVEEPDRGPVWILTHSQRFLRPAYNLALSGEVRRRLPGIVDRRDFEVDLEVLDRELSREHALAIGIDEDGITILTPGGRIHEPGQPRPAGHGVKPD